MAFAFTDIAGETHEVDDDQEYSLVNIPNVCKDNPSIYKLETDYNVYTIDKETHDAVKNYIDENTIKP